MTDNSDQTFRFRATSKYWNHSLYKWCPTSFAEIENAENAILSKLKCTYNRFFVNIAPNINIWTILCSPSNYDQKNEFESCNHNCDIKTKNYNKNIPLVMVHGFAAGMAFWVKNLDSLSAKRKLYAFDLLGFGKSSRIDFSNNSEEAEKQFIISIENWRKSLNLDKIILLGHSFGAYLAASYALQYPDPIEHLILCDPWGFPQKPNKDTTLPSKVNAPLWLKMAAVFFQPFNPLSAVRLAGPWGQVLVEKMRPDLQRKFTDVLGDGDNSVTKYVYHCNAQYPSGETAFTSMTIPYGWAKRPMITRIGKLKATIPITFIYGSRSWVDSNVGFQVKYLRPESYVGVKIITGAGHHVYADRPKEFNHIVNSICQRVDEAFNKPPPPPPNDKNEGIKSPNISIPPSNNTIKPESQMDENVTEGKTIIPAPETKPTDPLPDEQFLPPFVE